MKVYIGLPVYGQIEAETAKCLSITKEVLKALGMTVEVDMHVGCSAIAKARNAIAKRFMDSGFSRLLWIDADMVWDAIDVVKLLKSNHDCCGISYKTKGDHGSFVAILDGTEADGWYGAYYTGTGMLVTSRECIQRMIESYPETYYKDVDGIDYHAIFDFGVVDGMYWGEDALFCKRWRDIGEEIWILPAKIGHIGKKTFWADLGEEL